MRILHLPSSYLPDTLGGTEVYVSQLVAGLDAHGHESLVAWQATSPALAPHARALPRDATPDRVSLYRKSTGRDPAGFLALLEASQPDLVHFHAYTLGAGLDHARAAQRLGVPYVITFHTPSMACGRGTWLLHGAEACDGVLDPGRCSACVLSTRWPRPMAQMLARSRLPARALPDGPWLPLVAQRSLLAEAQQSWRAFFGGARQVVACAEFVVERLVRNGVPSERVSLLRQALPGATRTRTLRVPRIPGTRALRLGYFGRITPVKGPDLLVEAARRLRHEGMPVDVELAGPVDAPAWAESSLFAGRPWVHSRGVLREGALQGWLSELDLAVLPSRGFETGPLTLLEAWDAGTTVIGTDLGGIAEFMRAAGLGENLFGVNDPDSIAAAIKRQLASDGPPPQVRIPGMDELTCEMIRVYERALR